VKRMKMISARVTRPGVGKPDGRKNGRTSHPVNSRVIRGEPRKNST
jgi:hypothetical protein